jgi:hypothetical protein
LLAIFSIPHLLKSSMAGLDNVEHWRINFCGPKLEKRIKTEALYFNGFAVSVAILSYVNAVIYAKPLENDEDIFYPLAIFKEFVPQWQNVLSALYRATFFLIPLILTTPCYILIYVTSHLRFQFYMLLHFLKNINNRYETTEPNQLVDNLHYQKEITRRLKFCIRRYSILYT